MALDDLADRDLVIEAVFENMEIKKEVFGKLDRIVKQGAILATNTSYLNVDEIASATKRPESVIGWHFFSPANVMRLLEVVRGEKSSKPVIATSMQMARKIGKIAALVGVCPGFVGNRMLAQRQREAQKLILEGAMPWDVDRVLYDFGFPMGPFAMSDLAGLDIGWSKEKSTSSTVREILCEMDRRGQKTGAGFYDYDSERNAKPSPVVEKIILDFAAKKGVNRRTISDEEILERCVYPMINEGAKILEEGKAIRASDIDIVWINGYGWPVYRGGPMFFGDTIGLDKVLAKMKQFEGQMGAEFAPSKLWKAGVKEAVSDLSDPGATDKACLLTDLQIRSRTVKRQAVINSTKPCARPLSFLTLARAREVSRGGFNKTSNMEMLGHAIEHAVKRSKVDAKKSKTSSRAAWRHRGTWRGPGLCLRACRSRRRGRRSIGLVRPG